MALDKLVDSTQLDGDLTSVANAIRAKSGGSGQLAFPAGFVSEIGNIPSGGGGRPTAYENDVILIDYDGHILYSYTKAEFLALESMPTPPTPPCTGLTSVGWNWTLSDAKAYVTAYGEHLIGAEYTSTDDLHHILFESIAGNTFYLGFYIPAGGGTGNTITIDWGDGSEATVETGIGNNITKNYYHDYGNTGLYHIAISCSSSRGAVNGIRFPGRVRLITRAKTQYSPKIPSGSFGYIYTSGVKGTLSSFADNYRGHALVFPSGFTVTTGTSNWFTKMGQSLIYVSWPKGAVGAMYGYNYSGCTALSKLCMPEETTEINTSVCKSCSGLYRLHITKNVATIAAEAFSGCNQLRELHFHPTSPPTVANSNAFTSLSTSCKIYVPTGYLTAYTTASNYPDPQTYTYVEE